MTPKKPYVKFSDQSGNFPIFLLSIFLILTIVTSRITRLCRTFFWGSKKPLVTWNDICLSISEGGLGFGDIKCWNLALLAKSVWNIHAKKEKKKILFGPSRSIIFIFREHLFGVGSLREKI